MQEIILASSSPYRRAQLEGLGMRFTCVAPAVDEQALAHETARALVERLAIVKASAVAARLRHGLVIGSDQIALVDAQVLGKPGNHERATAQLRRCSAREVVYLSSVAVINAHTQRVQIDVARTTVGFRKLSDDTIERYLRADAPYQCAGSIKAESLACTLMRYQRSDDPSAIIGLPLIMLLRMLRAENFDLLMTVHPDRE